MNRIRESVEQSRGGCIIASGLQGDTAGRSDQSPSRGKSASLPPGMVPLDEVLRLIQAAGQSVGEPAVGKFIAGKVRDCLG